MIFLVYLHNYLLLKEHTFKWNSHIVKFGTTIKPNNYTCHLLYTCTHKLNIIQGDQQYAEHNPFPLFAAELRASENPCWCVSHSPGVCIICQQFTQIQLTKFIAIIVSVKNLKTVLDIRQEPTDIDSYW